MTESEAGSYVAGANGSPDGLAEPAAGGYQDELDVGLDHLLYAAKVHLTAVRSGRDQAIEQAYDALAVATENYNQLLRRTTGESAPWRRGISERTTTTTDDLVRDGMTISVRKRRDYTVPNVDQLLDAATEAKSEASSTGGQHDVHWRDERPIADVGEAVYELLQAADGSMSGLDIPELWAGEGLIMVNAVARALDLTADAGYGEQDQPFVVRPDTAVLMRIDERVDRGVETEPYDPYDDDGA